MRARRIAPPILLVLCALLVVACRREPERPPLVVLVSIDTLRRDALRAFDPGAAPHAALDRLADASLRFARAAPTASWTLPAHGSMLTGLQPDRHGATDPHVALATGVATLAERFRAGGWETVGLTNGGYLDRRYGFDRGFDRYADDPPAVSTEADATHSVFDAAAELVASRTGEKPLFLFLQTYSVHDYFRLRPWAVAAVGTEPPRKASDYLGCLQGSLRCDAADWELLHQLYDAEVANVDACFARLRAALERAGLWDRAIVLVTSDHGEGFEPARHRIHHGGRLHEDVIRIPLLLRAPGAAARTVDAPVSLVDVVPTLLALANLPPIEGVDGRSFADAVRGADAAFAAPRPLFAVEHYSAWWRDTRTRAATVQARPLAIAAIEGDRWYLRAGGREEVYDVASDPHQERDLAASAPDLAALREAAQQRDVDRTQTPAVQTNEDLQERLRALGYGE